MEEIELSRTSPKFANQKQFNIIRFYLDSIVSETDASGECGSRTQRQQQRTTHLYKHRSKLIDSLSPVFHSI